MNVFEDFSEEIRRRRDRLSQGVLLRCVTSDTLVELDGWKKFSEELNLDSCLKRNWRGLAGKLLEPPPTSTTIETISKSANPARELLTTWAQSDAPNKTFDSLMTIMAECELYSACDEFLEFLENCEKDSHLGLEEPPEESNEVVPYKPMDINDEITQPSDVEQTTHIVNEQQQQRPANIDSPSLGRSISCPADVRWFSRFRRVARKIFKRSKSYPPVIPDQPPTFTLKLPQDEILVVSSNSDYQTKGMKDLMSFVKKLQPVAKGALTVKTIHDLDHHGQAMTTWVQERVNRAKYVILCFSAIMKQIVDGQSDTPRYESQTEYMIKFTMDILVTGNLLMNGSRNPEGKFIPVLLPGHDISTLIFPLMCYLHFSWPQDEKRISNYIMNLPEHPIPPQGTPKQLVRTSFSWDQ